MPKWLILAGILLTAAIAVAAVSLMQKPAVQVSETIPTTAAPETTEAVTEPATVPTAAAARDYEIVELVEGQIQTPYGTLNYPEGLADHLLIVNTSQQPYTLEFYAVMEAKHEIRLFDISLGEGSGGNMGVVTTSAGEEIPLNVNIYTVETDDSWTDGEVITVHAMQDVINEMIDQMGPKLPEDETAEEPVIIQQPEESYSINNLEIETPYATLYYPARWAGTLSYSHDDSQEEIYKVHFYSRIEGRENQLLFSIYFGGDEGEQLGAVMGQDEVPVPVNILLAELTLDGWTTEEAEILYSMQEASNELIARLPLLD